MKRVRLHIIHQRIQIAYSPSLVVRTSSLKFPGKKMVNSTATLTEDMNRLRPLRTPYGRHRCHI